MVRIDAIGGLLSNFKHFSVVLSHVLSAQKFFLLLSIGRERIHL